MAFSVIILIFPTTPTPTSADFNYTIVVLGGWLSLCTLYFFFPHYGGRYWFRGPVSTIEKQEESRASSVSVEGLSEGKEKYEAE